MTGDRRPVSARGWGPVRATADWLVRRRASPDAISLGGMVAAMAAGALLGFGGGGAALVLAALLIELRLLANVLDGMVAVGRGVASPLGELFNELPDRISDCAVLAGLGLAAGSPALGWAAALMAVLTAYVRAAGRAAGAPSDFRGPMAKQQRMHVAAAAALVCAALPGSAPEIARGALWLVAAGSALTAARRTTGIARALRA